MNVDHERRKLDSNDIRTPGKGAQADNLRGQAYYLATEADKYFSVFTMRKFGTRGGTPILRTFENVLRRLVLEEPTV